MQRPTWALLAPLLVKRPGNLLCVRVQFQHGAQLWAMLINGFDARLILLYQRQSGKFSRRHASLEFGNGGFNEIVRPWVSVPAFARERGGWHTRQRRRGSRCRHPGQHAPIAAFACGWSFCHLSPPKIAWCLEMALRSLMKVSAVVYSARLQTIPLCFVRLS